MRARAANSHVWNTKVIAPLKYLKNLQGSHNLLMSNCKIGLDLTSAKHCVISEILNIAEVPANPAGNLPILHPWEGTSTNATFKTPCPSNHYVCQW